MHESPAWASGVSISRWAVEANGGQLTFESSSGPGAGSTFRITLPRAIRICLPTMSTEVILLLKATALASTVTVYEVLGMAQFIRQQSFRTYETLIGAGLVYIALVFVLTRILNWLERYLNKDRERPVSVPLAQVAKP